MNETPMPQIMPSFRKAGRSRGEEIPGYVIVPIARGWKSAIPLGLNRWQAFEQVTLARCLVAAKISGPNSYLTGLASAAMHGAQSWRKAPDITVVVSGNARRTSRVLPAVTYRLDDNCVLNIPEVKLKRVLRETDSPPKLNMISGVKVLSIPQTMIEIAKYQRPYYALAVLDSLARIHCQASRFERERSLKNQAVLAKRISEMLATQAGVRGVRRARGVMLHVSCLAESPGESAMRWILLTHGIRDFTLQPRMRVGGKDYYPDIFLEIPAIASEYEGLNKYDNPATGKAEAHRKVDLSRLGVQLVHMDGRDLHNRQQYLAHLLTVFSAKGYHPDLKPARELFG